MPGSNTILGCVCTSVLYIIYIYIIYIIYIIYTCMYVKWGKYDPILTIAKLVRAC